MYSPKHENDIAGECPEKKGNIADVRYPPNQMDNKTGTGSITS